MLGQIFRALMRAVRSQLHPTMLGLLLLPLLITVVVSGLLLYVLWEPVSARLQSGMVAFGPLRWLVDVTASWGWDSLSGFLVPMVATILVFTATMLIALVFMAAFGMPLVLKFLQRDYPGVMVRGDTPWWASVLNAAVSVALFILMYALSMPFWLIPPLFVALPMLAWGWLNARLLRFDALSVHATQAERRALFQKHRFSFLMLGIAVAVLSSIPPLFLIMPVFSSLAFAHYAMAALEQLRAAEPVAEPVTVLATSRP